MSFLFGAGKSRSKPKSPQELVRQLVDLFNKMDFSERKKSVGEISKVLDQIELILNGDQETEPSPDQIGILAQEVYFSDILIPLVAYLHILSFDARKNVITIFTTLLRRKIGNRSPTVDYLATRSEIFERLIEQNANVEIALNVGTIVRDCVKHEQLAARLLESPSVWHYFDYINSSMFEVSTDAFSTLHDLLTLHASLSSKFLVANSDLFSERINALMSSDNYVTKRQSLKLMAQLLRQRSNYAFMTEYIESADNLKLIMVLLRDKSKNIQFEAFHIFKIFVANPKKSKPIFDILVKNKSKLLNFLPGFHADRKDDDFFHEEKTFISKQIMLLPDYIGSTTSSSSTTSLDKMASTKQSQLSPLTSSSSSTSVSTAFVSSNPAITSASTSASIDPYNNYLNSPNISVNVDSSMQPPSRRRPSLVSETNGGSYSKASSP